MKMFENKTVKSFITKKFEVSLVQDYNGRYKITYKTGKTSNESEWITDFGTASFMFDLKIKDLEGN